MSKRFEQTLYQIMYTNRNHIQFSSVQFSSVTQSCPTLCDRMDFVQHTRPPCPSSTPGDYSDSCPLSRWCHPTISSSVVPFSHLQSFPVSGSFQISQFFASGGQSTGVSASASVLPMNIQDWFPLGWTGRISLLPKGLTIKSIQYHNMVGRIMASKRWPPPNLWNLWTYDLTWQKELCRCD